MFNFIKNVFVSSPEMEKRNFDYNEEIEKLKISIEKHKKFRNIDYHTLKDFKEYVENSEYVTDYIKGKTLRNISLLKPLYFLREETDKYLSMVTNYFLDAEIVKINDLFNHLSLLRERDRIIDDENNECELKIKEAKEFIEKTKREFDKALEQIKQ